MSHYTRLITAVVGDDRLHKISIAECTVSLTQSINGLLMKISSLNLVRSLSIALLIVLGHSYSAKAVEAFVKPSGKVEWSKVVNSAAGPIVYDQTPNKNREVLSSWSKSGIHMTSYVENITTGYTTQEHTVEVPYQVSINNSNNSSSMETRYRTERTTEQVPQSRRDVVSDSPESLQFTINGQIFTYRSGPVSPELASALGNASDDNLKLHIVFANASTIDSGVNKNTIQAWKQIFNDSPPTAPTAPTPIPPKPRPDASAENDRVGGLIAQLKSPDVKAQGAAAEALGQLGTSVIPQLILLQKDPNIEVRQAAFEALQRVGNPTAAEVPQLIALLSDANETVQSNAIGQLGSIGEPAKAAIPQLIPLLQSPSAQIRKVTVFTLGSMGQPAKVAIPQILPLVKDADKVVRVFAVKALEKLGYQR